MAIYKATCDNCGYTNEQFLKADKDTIPYTCKGCKHTITMSQVRDYKVTTSTNNEVTGVYERETR